MLQNMKEQNPGEALRLLCLCQCEFFPGLESPIRELVWKSFQKEDPSEIINLKKVIQNLLKDSNLDNNLRAEFSQVLRVSHLLCQRDLLLAKDQHKMAARVRFSLLRYVGTIPAYNAFFQAGQALRRVGFDKLAFVVLNIFLDMYEAVDESVPLEISDTENLELLDFPNLEELALPESNIISESEKNGIRDWLLSTSTKYGTELCLDKTRCSHCGAHISDKCLSCPKCLGLLGEMCIISGELIQNQETHNCSNCHKSCLLYTSPSPRDGLLSRMPSSA